MPRPQFQQSQNPVQQLANLTLQRASVAASLPTDEEFEALLSAQEGAQRAARSASQEQIVALDAQIAELNQA